MPKQLLQKSASLAATLQKQKTPSNQPNRLTLKKLPLTARNLSKIRRTSRARRKLPSTAISSPAIITILLVKTDLTTTNPQVTNNRPRPMKRKRSRTLRAMTSSQSNTMPMTLNTTREVAANVHAINIIVIRVVIEKTNRISTTSASNNTTPPRTQVTITAMAIVAAAMTTSVTSVVSVNGIVTVLAIVVVIRIRTRTISKRHPITTRCYRFRVSSTS